jgi:hypothetical protein
LLQYSPNGEKLIVAGLANFVRTYNTGDEENVVIVDNVPDETNAVIAGVSMAKSMIQNAGSDKRTGRLLYRGQRRRPGLPIQHTTEETGQAACTIVTTHTCSGPIPRRAVGGRFERVSEHPVDYWHRS